MNYRQLRILRQTELHPIHALLPLPAVTVKLSPSMQTSSERLYSPEPKVPPSNTANEFTVASVVAAAIFFTLFAVYLRYFANRRQPRALSPGKGVDRSTILSLPVYDFTGAAKYQMDCAICLSEFGENETVKVIPFCQHSFHIECIDTWLFSHVSCPVCRSTRLFAADKDVGGGGSGVAKKHRQPSLRDGGETSTADNNDTRINIGSLGNGMRRISSCTSFAGRASMSLPRTCSF